jgi:hypothetical protein
MAAPQPVPPVKLIVAVLWARSTTLGYAIDLMIERWGEIDFQGEDHPFDVTNYYTAEMGANLKRRLLSFTELVPPEGIKLAKLACNTIEDNLRNERGREVNLDIGYLDHNKIVLASCKYAGQKIPLGDGVHADLIARYAKGKYQPFEWTFPDFKTDRYDAELNAIRQRYLEQLRRSG